MKRYWVSWEQLSSDYRPLQDPPQPKNICAWWCSGHSFNAAFICAIVEAKNEEHVKEVVKAAWDSNGKDIGEWRFIDEIEPEWLPNNRFPITKDWEKERLKIVKESAA